MKLSLNSLHKCAIIILELHIIKHAMLVTDSARVIAIQVGEISGCNPPNSDSKHLSFLHILHN
jgi:hypothetical protein